MSEYRILVTGATGVVGSLVVDALERAAAEGRTVDGRRPAAICTTRSAEKAANLEKQGRKAVLLDLDAPASFPAVLEGIDAVFLLTGYTADMCQQTKWFADAAKAAGVKHLVHLGAINPGFAARPRRALHRHHDAHCLHAPPPGLLRRERAAVRRPPADPRRRRVEHAGARRADALDLVGGHGGGRGRRATRPADPHRQDVHAGHAGGDVRRGVQRVFGGAGEGDQVQHAGRGCVLRGGAQGDAAGCRQVAVPEVHLDRGKGSRGRVPRATGQGPARTGKHDKGFAGRGEPAGQETHGPAGIRAGQPRGVLEVATFYNENSLSTALLVSPVEVKVLHPPPVPLLPSWVQGIHRPEPCDGNDIPSKSIEFHFRTTGLLRPLRRIRHAWQYGAGILRRGSLVRGTDLRIRGRRGLSRPRGDELVQDSDPGFPRGRRIAPQHPRALVRGRHSVQCVAKELNHGIPVLRVVHRRLRYRSDQYERVVPTASAPDVALDDAPRQLGRRPLDAEA